MAIEFNQVFKEYSWYNEHCLGKTTAIDNVSMRVIRGEIVGLTGENGSGKSTLARMANGLIKPTDGRVLIDGLNTADLDSLQEIRRRVGILFQYPDHQIINPVVEEDVAFGPLNLGLTSVEVHKRVDWALKQLGIEELRFHSPHRLSGGQKQKVAIAGLLAMQPSYLVLDEPTSMLDPPSRVEFLHQINQLRQEWDLGILLISHNPDDFMIADRLVVLSHGKIAVQGKMTDLLAEWQRVYPLGVSFPGLTEVAYQLKRRGYSPPPLNTTEELMEYICRQLKSSI